MKGETCMYKVMIIDDEKAIRGLLKSSVNWELLNMQVAGEAESGIEAINTIDDIRPHVVFVDIKMPFMDGIEFSRLAIKRYPRLKIIVLTAFNEFEYARQCIGIGISECKCIGISQCKRKFLSKSKCKCIRIGISERKCECIGICQCVI